MCNACKVNVADQDAATEHFAGELLDTLNRATLGLGLAIGHRTGLFDSMAAMNCWASSEEIAAASACNERYVREWLGAMVTGGVVAFDSEATTYFLPPHHAALLTRSAGSNNFARTFQFLAVMAEDSDGNVVEGLFTKILPMVDGLAERLEEGIDVMDIGCGSGHAMIALAKRFPNSRFVGRDLCEKPILAARRQAGAEGLTNITFEVADVSERMESDGYDLITAFDVIHDQRDPAAVLELVQDALRPGGTFLMQDLQASSKLANNIDHALCPFLYMISTMHCMTVSLAQNGMGLGSVWGEELAVQMLGDAGFRDVTVQRLEHDIQNNWYVSMSG
ncbi:class I SAM-dependent methyltransferase [Rhodopirellula bahusiensis]|uniref:class I SAM-dependent methyltransferase n=1 Tax=Rhodopirellula bahusiensis TaxID=2014065 RepID=UPI0032638DF1